MCATKIYITKSADVSFYNFCIKEKTNNSPFNFQIYSDKNGFSDRVLYSQYVKDYKEGWNKVAVENDHLNLDTGVYYIAMQWIPLPDKSDVWSFMGDNNEYICIGQSLHMNKGNGKNLESFFYDDKWISTNSRYYKEVNYTYNIDVAENQQKCINLLSK